MSVLIQQRWNRKLMCQHAHLSLNMRILLENIEYFIENSQKTLKQSRTSTVVVVEVDNKQFVIKRSNTRSVMHFIRRLFARSRAKKNWDYAEKLKRSGINTFEPVALIEERFGFLRGRSYLICSYIEGRDALHTFACGAKPTPHWKIAAQNIALMLQKLASHGLYHRDLNLSNIILIDDKPWLIDLDSMRRHFGQWQKSHGARRSRRRFMENWQEAPQVSEDVEPLFEAVFKQYPLIIRI